MDREMQAMRIAQYKQAQDEQNAIRGAAREAFISPEQANAMNMGPTQPGAQPLNQQSGFNPGMFVNKVMQIDPIKGLEYKKALTPESQINKLDAKDFTPESVQRFNQTGNYGDLQRMDKLHFGDTGGAIVGLNQFTGQKISETQKTGNPYSDLVLRDANGNIIPNTPLVGVKTNLAQAGATRVNNQVSIAGPENEYNKDIGAGLAKQGLAQVEAAKNAPNAVQTAQGIKRVLQEGAITGTGAEARLAVEKALATAGLIDGKRVANTQQLMANLGEITLSAISGSGLGSGQGFTDKDRQFLADAKSGTIDSTPANLLRAADLHERAARAAHAKGSAVLQRWQKDPALKAVSQDTVLDPLPPVSAPAQQMPMMDTKPTPNASNRGKVLREVDANGNPTGKVFKSNGLQWVEQ